MNLENKASVKSVFFLKFLRWPTFSQSSKILVKYMYKCIRSYELTALYRKWNVSQYVLWYAKCCLQLKICKELMNCSH